jgi:thioredoxin reductase (NADPH)
MLFGGNPVGLVVGLHRPARAGQGGGACHVDSDYLPSRLEAHPPITSHTQTRVTGLSGTDTLDSRTIRDGASGQDWHRLVRALFIMVMAAPNTAWLSDLVRLHDKGFVPTAADAGESSPFATSCPGGVRRAKDRP